jgi:nitrite reductase/ring-hydroxylating ferredoxin subunit
MFKRAANLSDVDNDEIVPVELDGQELVVFRDGEAIRACQRYCPHQRADLSEGLVSRGFLICAAHGWSFDTETGVHEISEQTCLATYAVKVQGEEIHVDPRPIRNGAIPHD